MKSNYYHTNDLSVDFTNFRNEYYKIARYYALANQEHCTLSCEHRVEEALEDVYMNSLPKFDPSMGNIYSFVGRCLHNKLCTVMDYDKGRAERKSDDDENISSPFINASGKRKSFNENLDYHGYAEDESELEDGEGIEEEQLQGVNAYEDANAEITEVLDQFQTRFYDAKGCLFDSLTKTFSEMSELDRITLCGSDSDGNKYSREQIGKLRGGITPQNVGFQKCGLLADFSKALRNNFLSIYKGQNGEKIFARYLNKYAKGRTVVKNAGWLSNDLGCSM